MKGITAMKRILCAALSVFFLFSLFACAKDNPKEPPKSGQYTWLVEPYLAGDLSVVNSIWTTTPTEDYDHDCVQVAQNGLLGLADYSGKLVTPLRYNRITYAGFSIGDGENGTRKGEINPFPYLSVFYDLTFHDSDTNGLKYWDAYQDGVLYEGTQGFPPQDPDEDDGESRFEVLPTDWYGEREYYWLEDAQRMAETFDDMPKMVVAAVVPSMDVLEQGPNSLETHLTNITGYILLQDGQPFDGVVYEDCAAYYVTDDGFSYEGFAALQKDGKWGCVNRDGLEILPFIFEGAKNIKIETRDPANDTSATTVVKKIGYHPVKGYVTVCKDDKYGIYDTKGICVVDCQFEEALPVHEGKCWVKQDGKWGMIQINGFAAE